MIAFVVLFSVLYGYLAHQTRAFIYVRFGEGWKELISYTLGVLFVYPVAALLALLFFKRFLGYLKTLDEKEALRLILTIFTGVYFAAYCPFGLGTFLGWLMDGYGIANE